MILTYTTLCVYTQTCSACCRRCSFFCSSLNKAANPSPTHPLGLHCPPPTPLTSPDGARACVSSCAAPASSAHDHPQPAHCAHACVPSCAATASPAHDDPHPGPSSHSAQPAPPAAAAAAERVHAIRRRCRQQQPHAACFQPRDLEALPEQAHRSIPKDQPALMACCKNDDMGRMTSPAAYSPPRRLSDALNLVTSWPFSSRTCLARLLYIGTNSCIHCFPCHFMTEETQEALAIKGSFVEGGL